MSKGDNPKIETLHHGNFFNGFRSFGLRQVFQIIWGWFQAYLIKYLEFKYFSGKIVTSAAIFPYKIPCSKIFLDIKCLFVNRFPKFSTFTFFVSLSLSLFLYLSFIIIDVLYAAVKIIYVSFVCWDKTKIYCNWYCEENFWVYIPCILYI